MERKTITTIVAETIKGTSFVGISNYLNSKGELSNQTILVGATYETAKAADIETAKAFDLSAHKSQFTEADLIVAKESIIASLEKPSKAHSEGQKAAYKHIAPGLKVHTETDEVYVTGFAISKVVLEKGTYKTVNSSTKTLAKKELTKAMNLKSSKFRNFKLGNSKSLQMQGVSL
tara:strand:+ start:155 stop:679 length:525 start_codon:yes stop_codon:yes gene_type:complete